LHSLLRSLASFSTTAITPTAADEQSDNDNNDYEDDGIDREVGGVYHCWMVVSRGDDDWRVHFGYVGRPRKAANWTPNGLSCNGNDLGGIYF
jgi:hypothetical protein